MTCPHGDCSARVYVEARYVLESTDGPVEHMKVRCTVGHWYDASVDSLLPQEGTP
jgi:hypothetical protein